MSDDIKINEAEKRSGTKDAPVERLGMTDGMTFEQPSVFKGEIPFLTLRTDEGKVIGKLWGTGGVLSFEGDAEKSARIFFDQIIELNRARLEA